MVTCPQKQTEAKLELTVVYIHSSGGKEEAGPAGKKVQPGNSREARKTWCVQRTGSSVCWGQSIKRPRGPDSIVLSAVQRTSLCQVEDLVTAWGRYGQASVCLYNNDVRQLAWITVTFLQGQQYI